MDKFKFRILLLTSILFAVVAAVTEFFFPTDILQSILDYSSEIEPELSELNSTIFWIFGSLTLVSIIPAYIGLFLFKNWARHLYSLSLVFPLPTYITYHSFVVSGLAQIFYDLSLITSGVILALVYFSDTRAHFVEQQI